VQTGKRFYRRCPRLVERGHGSWQFRCYVRDLWGEPVQVARGGFRSQAAAVRARADLAAQSREQFAGRTWTVAQWLRYWLTTRRSIRPTTLHIYARHVEKDLIPTIGRLRLAELTGRHLTAMFAELATCPNTGQLRTASMMQRIRATLRAAYNAAIREGLVADNPARRVEMPQPRRPHAVSWTDGRMESWQCDGVRPAIAVWTTAQTAAFLEHVQTIRCTRSGGWPPCAVCGVVRQPDYGGRTSSWTGDNSRS
jgi:hypothetical protein